MHYMILPFSPVHSMYLKNSVPFILNEQILLSQTGNFSVKYVTTIFSQIEALFFLSQKKIERGQNALNKFYHYKINTVKSLCSRYFHFFLRALQFLRSKDMLVGLHKTEVDCVFQRLFE